MKPVEERFWSLVSVGPPDVCWEWLGYKTKKGYGQLPVMHPHRRAHRMAFELSGGRLKPGEVVLHRCDNPPCCNPRHLFAGTQLDNVRDRQSKGRQAKGESSGNFGKFGAEHPAFGSIRSEEHRKAIANSKRGDNSPARRYRYICQYCGKESGCGQHARWHGENCKHKGAAKC